MGNNVDRPSLGTCLMMDFIGMASYFVPIFGETADIAWAFISAYCFYSWFHSSAGTIGAFVEEVLPFTDIVPSFTLGYALTSGK